MFIKIVKNDTGIDAFKKHKYLLYSETFGYDAYAKIGFKPIIGLILAKIKFETNKLRKKRSC